MLQQSKNKTMKLFLSFYIFMTIILQQSQTALTWKTHDGFQVSNYQILHDIERYEIINPYDFSGRGTNINQFTVNARGSMASQNVEIYYGINGLRIEGSTYSFGFKVKTTNTSNTNFKFDVSLLGETVIYRLKFDVLIVDPSIPEILVGYKQVDLKILNKGDGIRSQNISFSLSSKPALKPSAGKFLFSAFPQGFNISNPTNITTNWGLNIDFGYHLNLTHFTVQVVTYECTIQFINLFVFLVDRFLSQDVNGYQRVYLVDLYNCPGTLCPETNTVSSSIDQKFRDAGDVFFGLQRFFIVKTTVDYFLDTATGNWNNLTNNFVRSGISARIGILSIAVRDCSGSQLYDPATQTCNPNCPSSAYPNQDTTNKVCSMCHYSCQTCVASGINDCTSCSAGNYRVDNNPSGTATQFDCLCSSGHFDNSKAYCQFCSTYIFGCLQCSNFVSCTTCMPGFLLTASNTCECNGTNLTLTNNGSCIPITGCVSYFVNSSSSNLYCIQCDIKNNFYLQNYTCLCDAGYTLNNATKLCAPDPNVCGDGILDPAVQFCDDGNLYIADGCDNLCQVQQEYECYTLFRKPSVCILDITQIHYIGAMKIIDDNKCVLYYKIYPYNSNLYSLNNMIQFFQSSLSLNPTFYNFGYKVQQKVIYTEHLILFTVQFEYSEPIDANITHFASLYLRDDYFPGHQYNRTITFNIIGQNLPLKMIDDYSGLDAFYYLLLIIIILSFIAAIISIFKQRWIGIEQIQTIQFFFFYFMMMDHIDEQNLPFMCYFQNSNGVSFQKQDMSYFQYIRFDDRLYTMCYNKEMVLNFNLTGMLVMLPIILMIIRPLVPKLISCFSQQKKRKNKYKNQTTTTQSQEQKPAQKIPEKYKRLKILFSSQFMIGKLFITLNLWFINQIIVSFFIQQSGNLDDTWTFNSIFQQIFTFLLLTSVVCCVGLIMIATFRPYDFSQQNYQYSDTASFIKFKMFPPTYACVFVLFNLFKIVMICLLFQKKASVYLIISLDTIYFISYCYYKPYKNQINCTKPQQKPKKLQKYYKQYQFIPNNTINQSFLLHNIHNGFNSVALIGLSIFIIVHNNHNLREKYTEVVLLRVFIILICFFSLLLCYARLFLSRKVKGCFENDEEDMENKVQQVIQDTDQARKLRIMNSFRQKSQLKQKQQNQYNKKYPNPNTNSNRNTNINPHTNANVNLNTNSKNYNKQQQQSSSRYTHNPNTASNTYTNPTRVNNNNKNNENNNNNNNNNYNNSNPYSYQQKNQTINTNNNINSNYNNTNTNTTTNTNTNTNNNTNTNTNNQQNFTSSKKIKYIPYYSNQKRFVTNNNYQDNHNNMGK